MIAAEARPSNGYRIAFTGALFFALLLKVVLLISDSIPFHGDEAVVGLMARHILEGERPVYYYGQSYMGSLDAYLVAAGFMVFGAQVWVIRMVQAILYLGVVFTTGLITQRISGSRAAAVTAAWFMAVPTVNTSLYTTVSLGGYGEVLLLGNLAILCSLTIAGKVREEKPVSLGLYGIFGLLLGISFWVLGLSVAFSIPALIYLGWHWQRYAPGIPKYRLVLPTMFILLGMIAGASPWWLSTINSGGDSQVGALVGSLFSVNIIELVSRNLLNLVVYGLPVIFGVRPPWSMEWLVIPAAPLVIAFWVLVLWHRIRHNLLAKGERDADYVLLVLVIFVLLAGFILTPFGRDPSGRYFIPLAAPMAALAGGFVAQAVNRHGRIAFFIAALILGYHGLGTWQAARINPPGLTTQLDVIAQVDHSYIESLIQFLQQNNETRGYSNYWISYPLAFSSGEEIIFAPALPYRKDLKFNTRDNRYLSYSDLVKDSGRVAYITARLPELDDYLRMKFHEMGVTWLEKKIGDYQIFYDLSEAVHADELGIQDVNP